MDLHGNDDASGIRQVARQDGDYPVWLSRIYAPPPVLWVRGRLAAREGEHAVAIVGARAATRAGLAFARLLAADLAAAGLTIVSGLARGIDTAAHQGALDAAGRTVAVLGSGLDRVYPSENAGLARAITRDGAVVSEFPPGTEPWKGNFPRRNRTIAGWARAVIVVEAGEKSGALLTARAALEEGRDVMAVPAHPTLPSAAGTNALLRDGAALVRDAGDVLSELGLARSPAGAPVCEQHSPLLAAFVRGAPTSLEEIAARIALPVPELLARLSELELAGRLRRLPGGCFVRS
jgi:DNA processing protein